MKFGPVDIDHAEGAILAHSATTPEGRIKKGRRLSGDDVAKLQRANVTSIIAATLDPDDIAEDEAATRVANAVVGNNARIAEAFTGRANVYAIADGILCVDRERLIALNRINEGLTVATLPPFERVRTGQMIATIKIITFALDSTIVDRAISLAAGALSPVAVSAFRPHDVALIMTDLPGTKPSVLDKRIKAICDRVESTGSRVIAHKTVAHQRESVEAAVLEMLADKANPILIFGASAIVDREDVIPGGVIDAGGDVVHLGMPVDPGNLLMLGRHAETTVIGVPSCASSPKTNGLDWVLERTLAGLEVDSDDLTEMAVGGLLMEIPTRPQPRASSAAANIDNAGRQAPRIVAVVLASGRSTRMGAANKLLEEFRSKPLVRHSVEAALQSSAASTVVVTGHEEDDIRAALAHLPINFAHNPRYADGLATSLAAGISSLPNDVDGAIILLGDMPLITSALIDQLIAAFAPHDSRSICVPYRNGRRGNPVLWSASFFADLARLSGDTGAKHIIAENADAVAEIDVQSDAIFTDVDTPDALAALREKS